MDVDDGGGPGGLPGGGDMMDWANAMGMDGAAAAAMGPMKTSEKGEPLPVHAAFNRHLPRSAAAGAVGRTRVPAAGLTMPPSRAAAVELVAEFGAQGAVMQVMQAAKEVLERELRELERDGDEEFEEAVGGVEDSEWRERLHQQMQYQDLQKQLAIVSRHPCCTACTTGLPRAAPIHGHLFLRMAFLRSRKLFLASYFDHGTSTCLRACAQIEEETEDMLSEDEKQRKRELDALDREGIVEISMPFGIDRKITVRREPPPPPRPVPWSRMVQVLHRDETSEMLVQRSTGESQAVAGFSHAMRNLQNEIERQEHMDALELTEAAQGLQPAVGDIRGPGATMLAPVQPMQLPLHIQHGKQRLFDNVLDINPV